MEPYKPSPFEGKGESLTTEAQPNQTGSQQTTLVWAAHNLTTTTTPTVTQYRWNAPKITTTTNNRTTKKNRKIGNITLTVWVTWHIFREGEIWGGTEVAFWWRDFAAREIWAGHGKKEKNQQPNTRGRFWWICGELCGEYIIVLAKNQSNVCTHLADASMSCNWVCHTKPYSYLHL